MASKNKLFQENKMPRRNDIYSAELLFFLTVFEFLFNVGHHDLKEKRRHLVCQSDC